MDSAQQLDEILEKIIRDVELSVHAFYRGELRQDTQRVKNDAVRKAARQALMPLLASDTSGDARASAPPPADAASGVLSPDETAAALRCVIAWLPMGAPSTASPQSRCMPAGRELAPSWGEREKARLALRR